MNITFMEAVSITISSMTIVLLTLGVIALILGSFKFIIKESPKGETKKTIVNKTVIDDTDEEEKLIACLVASAMAGDGKINPNLYIKRVTRII